MCLSRQGTKNQRSSTQYQTDPEFSRAAVSIEKLLLRIQATLSPWLPDQHVNPPKRLFTSTARLLGLCRDNSFRYLSRN